MFELLKKILKKLRFVFLFLIVLGILIFILSKGHIYDKNELEYGLTFSKKQAIDLSLDWQNVYVAIFEDLAVKKIRLSAYWDEVEPKSNEYFFDDLDWQINLAQEHKAQVILAIGNRLPRWPECHTPSWINEENKEKEILEYIEIVINRYKDRENIVGWQIENEPFLPHFGECPKLDTTLLDKEIALAKSLDTRDIVVTDSGELSFWIPAAKRADVFGTTMYRDTYSEKLKRYVHYPIGPGFFRFKKNITDIFASPKKWLVIEMQAEPWGPKPFQHLSQEERERTMNLEKFKDMIEFSSRTGFREFYLWGAEWWYWEKTTQNNNALWEEAGKLFLKD